MSFSPKLVACLAILLVVQVLPAQNRDDDVPVLKRRAPVSDQQAPPADTQPASPAPQPSQPPVVNPAPPTPEPHPAQTAPRPSQEQSASQRFLLTRSGGVMRVTAVDLNDADTAARISRHLRTLASQFSRGDFTGPQRDHGQALPGVENMRRLREKIIYTAHAIAGGGELIISSDDRRAIDAIHQFLQFQDREHNSGGPE